MISRIKKSRHLQFLCFLAILGLVLLVRLFFVTVIQHSEWKDTSENMSTKSIYVSAPRGEIYDRYGRLLAGNKQSFSVRVSSSGLDDEELNDNISKLITILDKNDDELVDDFPITISKGKFKYTFDEEITDWLRSMDLSTDLTAEEAFNALRSLYGIDPSLDRYDAQEELQNTYNQYPPISVSDMEYTAEQEKQTFIETYFGDDEDALDMTAEEAFKAIREDMKIDKALSDAQARRIMVVRNAIQSTGYSQYLPAVVAKDVSDDTVMELEEEENNLQGIEAVSETTRYYPNKNTAAHILGYMGVISEDEAEANDDYEEDALVGKEGIEGKLEDVLKGKNGEKTVLVNSQGELVETISEEEAEKGQDVYLTIDLDLQEAAEEGLEKTIKAISSGGSVKSEYGNSSISKTSANAATGAAVAIDVDSGEVLALASYPDYDPNLFAEGISTEDWDSLQSENSRDPLAASPLYNLATMATVQPGSTFKPVTATAAIESGLDPYKQLTDAGYIELGGTTFGCVVWNEYKTNHGSLAMPRALEVSCNYYFYDIATGKDWASGGTSLGYDDKISYKTITDYAEQYGLGKATGIEIDEAVVPVPSEERRLETLETNLSYELYANAEDYFTEKVYKNSEQLDKNIEIMKKWLEEDDLTWDDLYNNKMPEVGVKESQLQTVGEKILYDYYPQVDWSTGDTFNLAIGQGENAYTPLQMANYIATLGNGGTHNQVTLLKSIEDEALPEKEESTQVELDDESDLDAIIEGMKLVGSGSESTVSSIFDDLDVEVAAKTGTAERAGYINPESEVDYIKEHLSSIAPSLTWSEVEEEMNRLMEAYPATYSSQDTAVRKAVMNLADVSSSKLDAYKSEYENFAWVVAMAPADDPEIAVVAMVPQGATAANAAPIVKEILGAYFDEDSDDYEVMDTESSVE